MKKFSEYMSEKALVEEMEDKIGLMLYMAEKSDIIAESYDFENLTESQRIVLEEGVNDWLNKVGLKLHKTKGIIDYLADFTKGTGKVLMSAIKGDKEAVKEQLKNVKKEEVLDFLLKLDMATLHIVTGPIHLIDAVTGWDLMANVKAVAKTATDKLKEFYQAMKKVKETITTVLQGTKQKKMLQLATNLETTIPAP